MLPYIIFKIICFNAELRKIMYIFRDIIKILVLLFEVHNLLNRF